MGIGGAETHVFTLLKELKKRGLDLTLLCAGGEYADMLARLGVRCALAPLNKRDPISILRSRRILKNEIQKSDIVHCHTRFSAFLARSARGRAKLPKIVVTAHLNFPLFPFGKLAFYGEGTLAVSEDIREYLIKNYRFKKEDVTLTRNCISDDFLSANRKPKKLIVHTSRIDEGRSKAAFLLADAAREIKEEFPDWKILIVGDGNLFQELKNKIQKMRSDNVILLGKRSDIARILSFGSIFVGVSRAALEAMAEGIPTIILGDEGYGGIADNDNFDLLFRTNFCARGLKAATKEDLLQSIRTLIKSENTRRDLALWSKKKMKREYSPDIMLNDALCVYSHLLEERRILISGFFGYGNLGDEEMLKSALCALTARGYRNLSVLYNAKATLKAEAVKCVSRTDLFEIKRAMRRSDILIFAGGNLLQNQTSLRSLLYYAHLVSLAERSGMRIYMISSGFGELRGPLAEHICKRTLRRVYFCGCRTKYDKAVAESFGVPSRLMPDLCFLRVCADRHESGSRLVFVFASHGTISASDIIEIANKRGLSVLGVSLFQSEDMHRRAEAEFSKIPCAYVSSLEEFKNITKGATFVISERLHGAIFSILCGIPSYLTEDSLKHRALIADIGGALGNILMPYSKSACENKKEIGAKDSDFNYLIDNASRMINDTLDEIFKA